VERTEETALFVLPFCLVEENQERTSALSEKQKNRKKWSGCFGNFAFNKFQKRDEHSA